MLTDPSTTEPTARPGFALPETRVSHPAAIRRHRWLTLPSSAVLVICIFLPTLRVCGKPAIPLQFPMFWTPYVVGGLVFAAVLVWPSSLRGLAVALRVVLGMTVFGFGLPALGYRGPIGLELLGFLAAVSTSVVAIALPARTDESMCARLGVVTGVASTVWFAGLASDRDAMFGAHLSVGAAIGMTLGCAWWWLEASAQRTR